MNKIITIILVLTTSLVCCQLPTDKIVSYTQAKGVISGVKTPKNVMSRDNYLYIQDATGLYMVNLQMIDYDGETISDKDYVYKNDSNTYGSIINFDASGDDVYICTYKSSTNKYYILKHTIYLGIYEPFCLPNSRSVSHIDIAGSNLMITGNTNVALKGIETKDESGDIIFDTTADYVVTKEISVSPAKPIGVKTSYGYDIFMISMAPDQCGIRKYIYDTDETTDAVTLQATLSLHLYPFDIALREGSTNTLISSEQGRVAIYDLTDSEPYISLKSSIDIGSENGALRTIQYKDKLVALYGYKITANKYDKDSYDIYAYWCGAKVITNPYSENAEVTKTITIDGWGTDCAIYEDYLFVANQVKNCINIYNLQ